MYTFATALTFLAYALTVDATPVPDSLAVRGGSGAPPPPTFAPVCSAGNPYCCNDKSCTWLSNSSVTCTSGSVVCCNSNAGLINVGLAICGDSVNIPITISALNGPLL